MSIITQALQQVCVYWPCTGYDAHGQPVPGTAVQLDCRWVDEHQEYITAKGEKQISNANVMVSADVTPDGWLWLGALEAVTDAINPWNNADAWPIMQYNKTPNLNATEFLRIAIL